MDKILLMDGNSILNRAFYGLPLLSDEKGRYTNAVFGFLLAFFKTLEKENPSKVVVAFDRKAPTFRHKMYAEYKGTRNKMPEELVCQLPLIREVLDAMRIRYVEQDGIEADDILGTIAKKAEKEGYLVSILTGDRDLLQLATDKVKIMIPSTKSKKTETKEYYAVDVKAEFEVTPEEFIDLKGLMGDSSDNIPGVAGIGIKTATDIIKQYQSIENAYAHVTELKKSVSAKLMEGIESARLSKELATIKTDCELDFAFEDFQIADFHHPEVAALFQELKFYSLLSKVSGFAGAQVQSQERAEGSVEIFPLEKLTRIPYAEKRALYYLAEKGRVWMTLYDGKDILYYQDEISRSKPSIERVFSHTDELTLYDLKSFLHIFEKSHREVSRKKIWDVTIGAYLLSPNESDYLIESLGYRYTEMAVVKEEELFGKGKQRKFLLEIEEGELKQYLSKAVQIVWQSGSKIRQELQENGLEKLYQEVELPLCAVLKEMETAGISANREALKEYSDTLGKQLDELTTQIYGYAGREFNINSPKQLGEVLFEELKLKAPKKGKTGYSTAADVLEKLKRDHPVVENVLEYRALSKLKSTYADGLQEYIAEDGKIHTTYVQTVAGTGRLSSTEPNLQNIPIRTKEGREIRRAFSAAEGYSFVGADYSQIELRLMAHLSEDPHFVEAYQNNQDIHRATAAQVFHVPFAEVTDLQRRNAKAVNFGIIYGISDYGLSQDLDISVKEAKEYIQNYFKQYPKVKTFMEDSVAIAKEKGFSITMFGRIRPIPELKSAQFMVRSFGERIAMNAPIQGGAADIIKIAMNRVFQALESEKIKGKLVLQVHDELILEVADEDAEKAKTILIREMEAAAELRVPLVAEGYIVKNWYDAK